MSDHLVLVAHIPGDQVEATRRFVARRGGTVESVSFASDASPAVSLAEGRRRMLAGATPRQIGVVDALYRLPGHEGSAQQIAKESGEPGPRSVEGALGGLGRLLSRYVPGERKRAVHLWLEETTDIDGVKRYRMRPDFISDVGRWPDAA